MKSKEIENEDAKKQEAFNESQPAEKKVAFFITPLGSNDSNIRRHTDGIIDAVIEPTLRKFDIDLVPPHKIDNPGNITKQIISYILSADLVIANLTGLNANVMYEVAVRHARRKPIIIIAEQGTVLPFDIAAERTIFYQNDMAGAVQLSRQLEQTILKALDDQTPDNPIYSGQEALIIQEIAKRDDNPVEAYIVEKLGKVDELYSLMQNIINSQKSSTSNSLRNLPKLFNYILEIDGPHLKESDYDKAVNLLNIVIPGIILNQRWESKDSLLIDFTTPIEVRNDLKKKLTTTLSAETGATVSLR